MKVIALSILLAGTCLTTHADEGMWLFNEPPRKILQERYQFDATQDWLDHLQKSSVRFNSGGSGSFVSEDGLLISNHHVGADALQKLGTKEKNYMRDGFHARTAAQEIQCLDLELNVLQSIEDVTARVNTAVPKDADPAKAFAARRKIIAAIEKESQDRTGMRSDVVTLWQGGAYHLYLYKRYTDVRLVFAPEQQIAFYGGDPDNFEFPRYDLDICIFRAYENGQPARVKDYLRVSPAGPAAGDLVFVSGHPGHTSRLLTVAELKNLRDRALPDKLANYKRLESLLSNWSDRSEENERRARKALFGIANSRKASDGKLAGLLDPELFTAKIEAEQQLKDKLQGKPELADTLEAFEKISQATGKIAAQATRYELLEGGQGFNSESFRLARALLRAGEERPKPNGERLREFSESGKTSLELALFSAKPIYPDLEILTLTDSLTYLATTLGGDSTIVKQILAEKSPHARAVELINGTRMRDAGFRKQLYNAGASAVTAAKDPMIELARVIDGEARALRKIEEEQNEVKQEAHAALARARNSLPGGHGYPDATFTLRLAFGTVKNYAEDGHEVAAFTTLGGLFERAKMAKNRPPFDLPPLWEKRAHRINAKTPYNFVSTDDIIGGNSGSPAVNRAGEFVGIIFDGNLQSLPWDYAFSDKQGRATSVDSAAILEALNRVYGATELASEMRTGKKAK